MEQRITLSTAFLIFLNSCSLCFFMISYFLSIYMVFSRVMTLFSISFFLLIVLYLMTNVEIKISHKIIMSIGIVAFIIAWFVLVELSSFIDSLTPFIPGEYSRFLPIYEQALNDLFSTITFLIIYAGCGLVLYYSKDRPIKPKVEKPSKKPSFRI